MPTPASEKEHHNGLALLKKEIEVASDKGFESLAAYREQLIPFISEEISQQLLAKLQGDEERLLSDNNGDFIPPIDQPSIMAPVCRLRWYQLEGIAWLAHQYNKCINCCLADEMGLGKTLQSIAFIAYIKDVRKKYGQHLIVVPLNVLTNWINEFAKWCPALKVLRLHHNDKADIPRLIAKMDASENDVVVTTYEILKNPSFRSHIRSFDWRTVFIDEGHRIRNEQTDVAQTCNTLKARFKVILTGTPVQNNLNEAFSLLHFLAPRVFTDSSAFDSAFSLASAPLVAAAPAPSSSSSSPAVAITTTAATAIPTSGKGGSSGDRYGDATDCVSLDGKEAPEEGGQISLRAARTCTTTSVVDRRKLAQAHRVMRVFILRRLKSEVESNLPAKLETRINCPMTTLQKALVRELLRKDSGELGKVLAAMRIAKETKEVNEDKLTGQDCEGGSGVESSISADQEDSTEGDGVEKATAEKNAVLDLTPAAEEVRVNIRQRQSLNNLLAQLRKAANHPFLFEGVEKVSIDGRANESIVSASGKMIILDKLLAGLSRNGHRVVLFSQYTKVLDIINDFLDLRGYKYLRLDGSTNRTTRDINVTLFNRPSSEYFIFCITTRAGGEGINLASADTIILFDSDWNPQIDVQAMARVHRIGQTKVVHIYRLVTSGSVEERIVQRAQKKLFLDRMVNRGSTALARRASYLDDEEGEEGSGPPTGRKRKPAGDYLDPETQAESQRDILEALKFGCDSVFSMDNNNTESDGDVVIDFSDEDVQCLIDRTRGLSSGPEGISAEPVSRKDNCTIDSEFGVRTVFKARPSSSDGGSLAGGNDQANSVVGQNCATTTSTRILENQAHSLLEYNENDPLLSMSVAHRQAPAPAEDMHQKLTKKRKRRRNWLEIDGAALSAGPGLVGATREKTASNRVEEVFVEGLGMVSVLVETKPSETRAASAVDSGPLIYCKSSSRQVAGRDFDSQDWCQECWDGGDIILCDACPAGYHAHCLENPPRPEDKTFRCPHHRCVTCGRKASSAGVIFRCEVCSNAYCDECRPADHYIINECKRFKDLGYRMSPRSCYIHCSADCKSFAACLDSNYQIRTEYLVDGNLVVPALESAEAVEAVDPVKEAAARAEEARARIHRGISRCSLQDAKLRIFRNKDSPHIRFTSLSEIAGFASRWDAASNACKGVLSDIVAALNRAGAGADSDRVLNVLEFKGISPSCSDDVILQSFFTLLGELNSVRKTELLGVATLLGIRLLCSPYKPPPKRLETIGEPFLTCLEPRFRELSNAVTITRSIIEEAIAALLVTPSPQNMLIQYGFSGVQDAEADAEETGPGTEENSAPSSGAGSAAVPSIAAFDARKSASARVDSVVSVSRLLEALVQQVSDGLYSFTALSATMCRPRIDAIDKLASNKVFPIGGRQLSEEELRICTAPAWRLLNHVISDQNSDDPSKLMYSRISLIRRYLPYCHVEVDDIHDSSSSDKKKLMLSETIRASTQEYYDDDDLDSNDAKDEEGDCAEEYSEGDNDRKRKSHQKSSKGINRALRTEYRKIFYDFLKEHAVSLLLVDKDDISSIWLERRSESLERKLYKNSASMTIYTDNAHMNAIWRQTMDKWKAESQTRRNEKAKSRIKVEQLRASALDRLNFVRYTYEILSKNQSQLGLIDVPKNTLQLLSKELEQDVYLNRGHIVQHYSDRRLLRASILDFCRRRGFLAHRTVCHPASGSSEPQQPSPLLSSLEEHTVTLDRRKEMLRKIYTIISKYQSHFELVDASVQTMCAFASAIEQEVYRLRGHIVENYVDQRLLLQSTLDFCRRLVAANRSITSDTSQPQQLTLAYPTLATDDLHTTISQEDDQEPGVSKSHRFNMIQMTFDNLSRSRSHFGLVDVPPGTLVSLSKEFEQEVYRLRGHSVEHYVDQRLLQESFKDFRHRRRLFRRDVSLPTSSSTSAAEDPQTIVEQEDHLKSVHRNTVIMQIANVLNRGVIGLDAMDRETCIEYATLAEFFLSQTSESFGEYASKVKNITADHLKDLIGRIRSRQISAPPTASASSSHSSSHRGSSSSLNDQEVSRSATHLEDVHACAPDIPFTSASNQQDFDGVDIDNGVLTLDRAEMRTKIAGLLVEPGEISNMFSPAPDFFTKRGIASEIEKILYRDSRDRQSYFDSDNIRVAVKRFQDPSYRYSTVPPAVPPPSQPMSSSGNDNGCIEVIDLTTFSDDGGDNNSNGDNNNNNASPAAADVVIDEVPPAHMHQCVEKDPCDEKDQYAESPYINDLPEAEVINSLRGETRRHIIDSLAPQHSDDTAVLIDDILFDSANSLEEYQDLNRRNLLITSVNQLRCDEALLVQFRKDVQSQPWCRLKRSIIRNSFHTVLTIFGRKLVTSLSLIPSSVVDELVSELAGTAEQLLLGIRQSHLHDLTFNGKEVFSDVQSLYFKILRRKVEGLSSSSSSPSDESHHWWSSPSSIIEARSERRLEFHHDTSLEAVNLNLHSHESVSELASLMERSMVRTLDLDKYSDPKKSYEVRLHVLMLRKTDKKLWNTRDMRAKFFQRLLSFGWQSRGLKPLSSDECVSIASEMEVHLRELVDNLDVYWDDSIFESEFLRFVSYRGKLKSFWIRDDLRNRLVQYFTDRAPLVGLPTLPLSPKDAADKAALAEFIIFEKASRLDEYYGVDIEHVLKNIVQSDKRFWNRSFWRKRLSDVLAPTAEQSELELILAEESEFEKSNSMDEYYSNMDTALTLLQISIEERYQQKLVESRPSVINYVVALASETGLTLEPTYISSIALAAEEICLTMSGNSLSSYLEPSTFKERLRPVISQLLSKYEALRDVRSLAAAFEEYLSTNAESADWDSVFANPSFDRFREPEYQPWHTESDIQIRVWSSLSKLSKLFLDIVHKSVACIDRLNLPKDVMAYCSLLLQAEISLYHQCVTRDDYADADLRRRKMLSILEGQTDDAISNPDSDRRIDHTLDGIPNDIENVGPS